MVKRHRSSNRPLLSRTPSRKGKQAHADSADAELPFDIHDEVGQHVRQRQRQLKSGAGIGGRLSGSREKKLALEVDELGLAEEDVEEVEPELYEQDVLPVDVSDSDDEGDDDSSGDDEDADSDVDDGRPSSMKNKLEQRDWGSRRHVWYGGDTHEYEIMPDEEREVALAEEEEEAIALQKQAVDTLLPQDFIDDDLVNILDDGSNPDTDKGRKMSRSTNGNVEEPNSLDDHSAGAPEISILVKEAAACQHQLESLRVSAKLDQHAAALFHLNVIFLQNVACLLAIQSDPAATHVDIRKHPAIARIASIRSLIAQARRVEPVSKTRELKLHKQLKSNENRKGENPPVPKSNESPSVMNGYSVQRDGDRSGDGPVKKAEAAALLTPQKEKLKRKRSTPSQDAKPTTEEDDEQANALVGDLLKDKSTAFGSDDAAHERKRRKLNRLVFEMERDRHNKLAKRSVSGDADAARDSRRMQSAVAIHPSGVSAGDEGSNDVADDDNTRFEGVLDGDEESGETKLTAKEKRKARKARKKEEALKPHVYTFNDVIKADAKRKASKNIVANRGLTRSRPRNKKTPRTKNRMAYENAVKKSHSVTREFKGYPGLNYSGEATGINMGARKSSNLSLF